MQQTQTCLTCGLPIPEGAPAGHCPGCLMALANRIKESASPKAEPQFHAPERVFGEYTLGRQLGAGGMGIVYEAQRQGMERKVAVKLLRETHIASPLDVRRFTIEAEAAARLEHPNIVRIHEVGERQGHPFFSMDLIPGESLYAKMLKGEFAIDDLVGSRSRQEAIARLLAKTARAVHHAHERGVLHRDLKPANILVDLQGEPHLTDFGLAKIVQHPQSSPRPQELTVPGDLLGTPSYMSPEQMKGGRVTRAADIYSLGAILYELLTGQPPFSGTTPLETLKQIAEQPPVPPRKLDGFIHADLETICLKCLEKDPRYRFATAEALAEDLERWLARAPIKARRASGFRQIKEWVQRNPVGAALIFTLCAGLSVCLLLLKVVYDQRVEIEREWEQTFDEGINKIEPIWKDSDTREVTISARELAILAGRPSAQAAQAARQLCFGVSTDGAPSSMAQAYARLLSRLQDQLAQELKTTIAFRLKLFKRFNKDEESLLRGDADLMMLSAVDYLKAASQDPGIRPLARAKGDREAVIFAHTEALAGGIGDLRGKSMSFPDADLSMNAWAKARLYQVGLTARDLSAFTNYTDRGQETGQLLISYTETIDSVLRRRYDAGVTYRDRFERRKHLGLVMLDRFPDTPIVLAARKGLDPALLQGLHAALLKLGDQANLNGYASDVPNVLIPVEDSYFNTLQKALGDAARFDAAKPAPMAQTTRTRPITNP